MTDPKILQVKLPLAIAPRGGAIGADVTLEATGLPPQANLLIAFANLQSYQLLQSVLTDDDGSFTTTEKVPPWAMLDGVHYFFGSFSDERPLAMSDGFHVTAADGGARVEGTIGSQVEGCVELRNAADVLYHLVGGIGVQSPGDRVAVRGTIADVSSCGGLGVGMAVTDVTALPR